MEKYFLKFHENHQLLEELKDKEKTILETEQNIKDLEYIISKSNKEIDELTSQLPDLEIKKKESIKEKNFGKAN